MKPTLRIILLTSIVGVVLLALYTLVGAQAATPPTQVVWDYDFTLPTNKPCTTTLIVACVSGFTVQTIDSATKAVVSGPVAVFAPAVISTTGPTVGINTPFVPPTTLGIYATQIIVNWKDGAGANQVAFITTLTYPVNPTGVLNAHYQ